MHDSDYFDGLCPCNDFPCKRSVAAQAKLEAEENIRNAVVRTYYEHHEKWPQSAFVTAVIVAVQDATASAPPATVPPKTAWWRRAISKIMGKGAVS